jgi:hypothetical protein
MARLINLLPSALLVFLGAYAGTGKSFAFLRSGTVWLMSVLSGGVAIASVIVNDYFGECSLSCCDLRHCISCPSPRLKRPRAQFKQAFDCLFSS